MNTVGRTLASAFAAAFLLGAASQAGAQTFHMMAPPERGVWMEASYADIEEIDQSFPSTSWFISGRTPAFSGIRLIADVPFAYSRIRVAGGPRDSNSVLGNPYVGAEYRLRNVVMETGVRLPLNTIDADTYADVLGAVGDFQRAEAFSDKLFPISGAVTYEYGLPQGASIRGRAGVVGLISTDDELTGDDALIDYGLLGAYPVGRARFGLGFYGRWVSTEDEGDFGDNSVHHVALSGDMSLRGVRPGLAVRVPVDDSYNDVLSSTISVYLQVPLN